MRRRARAVAASLALVAAGCLHTSLASPVPQPVAIPPNQDFGELDFEQLSRIKVTTVTRRPEELFSSAAAVTVVRGEEIRRQGVRSIPEALRYIPGVQVARISSTEWAITSRGLNRANSNKLLVLIDGRTVYSPLFEGVFWDQQDVLLEDVDRIEVIRGPGGTLWGANAVNGIVNIITRKAQDTRGTLVVAGGGIEEKAFAAVRHGFDLSDTLAMRVYGTGYSRDGIEMSDGEDRGDDWTFGQAGFRIDWNRSERDVLTLQGDAYRGRAHQMPLVYSDTPPFVTQPDEILKTEGNNLLGRWRHGFTGGSELQTQVYFDRAQRTLEPQYGTLDVNTFDLDVQHRLPVGRQTWTWGLGYRLVWDDLDRRFTVDWTELRRTTARPSAFVQGEFALVPQKLVLTAGSKFERHEYSGLEVQPSLRMSWTPTSSHTVWGAASLAVRTPSRAEDSELATVVNPAGPSAFALRPNTRLEAEEMTSWELGYRYQIADRFMLDTAAFLSTYDDLFAFAELPFEPGPPLPTLPITLENAMEGTVYGLEVATRWLPVPRARLDLSYALLRDDLDAANPGAFLVEETLERDEANSPVQEWSVRSSLDLPRRWELDAALRYVGRLEGPEVPSYLVGDLRVGWAPTDLLEVSLTARGIGSEHPEFGPAGSGSAVRPVTEPRVYLTTRWRF